MPLGSEKTTRSVIVAASPHSTTMFTIAVSSACQSNLPSRAQGGGSSLRERCGPCTEHALPGRYGGRCV